MSEAATLVREQDRIGPRTPYRNPLAPPRSRTHRQDPTVTRPHVDRGPVRVDEARTLSFLHRYPEAWKVLTKALGERETLRLAQMRRNDAMKRLRVKHRWTLQAIADLFNLSRERIRQLTPPIEGNGKPPKLDEAGPPDSGTMRKELRAAFCKAVEIPDAWNGRGQVCKSWVVEELGYEPDLPDVDFRRPSKSKGEFILRYGLGLESRREMAAWLEEMYFEENMTYAEISEWLSERFVSIAPMTVHRFATEVLNVEGYGRGKRPDC